MYEVPLGRPSGGPPLVKYTPLLHWPVDLVGGAPGFRKPGGPPRHDGPLALGPSGQ